MDESGSHFDSQTGISEKITNARFLAQGLRPEYISKVEMALSLSKGLSKGLYIMDTTMSAWLYILRLKSGQLYIGSTTDLDRRFEEHMSGRACRTTQLNPPVKLLYSEGFDSFSDARRREAQIKRWSRAKKEALISGDLAG